MHEARAAGRVVITTAARENVQMKCNADSWKRHATQSVPRAREVADACDAIQAVTKQRSKRHRDTNDARSRRVEAKLAAASSHM